jgi:phosphatidylglycerophosphate synthase
VPNWQKYFDNYSDLLFVCLFVCLFGWLVAWLCPAYCCFVRGSIVSFYCVCVPACVGGAFVYVNKAERK